ncbi:ABC transporter ATP-binding protein [Desulfosporosinus fructosivorans]
MSSISIRVDGLGKMYKLYKKQSDKVLDAFGLNFRRKDYYREFWALRDVALNIEKGERVGLIGHNGAGKSTFLKIVIGNVSPTEGSVMVNGKIQALMELGTGFHPEFTGRENIRASLAYQGISQKEIRLKEEEIIDFSELDEFIDQPIRTYSAGMQARLSFSTATAIEPEILIIDEVLGAGDAYFAGKSVERMKRLTDKSGVTVVFVSHDLNSVQSLCNRVIWIDRGTIRSDGEPLEVIKQYSAEVRKNEEIRLRVRDLKLSKKQAAIVDRQQDLFFNFLFRFVGQQGQRAKTKNTIRLIRLLSANEEIARIDVGAPMDNNPEYDNFILDETGLMDWGPAEKDEQGYYRNYSDYGGKYGHAPFQMAVPKTVDLSRNLNLEISGEYFQDDVLVQLCNWDTNEYETCEVLAKSSKIHDRTILSIPLNTMQNYGDSGLIENYDVSSSDTKDPELRISGNSQIEHVLLESRDIRFSSFCKILTAKILDLDGNHRLVFPFERQLQGLSFKLKFSQALSQFIVVLSIFTSAGALVFNVFYDIKLEKNSTDANVEFDLINQRFGPEDYAISFAVYDKLDVLNNFVEQRSLAVIDRGLSFRVEKPIGFALNIGIVIPQIPIKVYSGKEENIECHSYL